MQLGYFIMPVHPQGRDYGETLREDREAFILADKLGYAEAFCGEHLTDRVENIPNALMFLASLAAQTKRITLGTAVVNLPYTHPVIVASNAAMLDTLLEGRFILGIGPGILRSDAEIIEMPESDRHARYLESIEHIVALWTGEAPYNLKGKFWNISTGKTLWPEVGLGSIVKAYQQPHPRIMGTASDPDSQSIVELGRRGWLAATSNLLHANWLKNHWTNYARGCAAAGRAADRNNWRVGRSIFVAEDDKVALRYGKADPNSPYRFYMRQLSEKIRKARRLRCFKRDDAMADEQVTLDYIVDELVIAGGVNSVVDQILAIHEKTGGFGTLLNAGPNWNDAQLARRSIELLAEKVMPAVNKAINQSAPAAAVAE